MAAWILPVEVVTWITGLSAALDARVAWRLLPLLSGALFAQGRKTVASWLRAGELCRDFRAYYYCLGSVGRNARSVAAMLFGLPIKSSLPACGCALRSTIRRRNATASGSK